MFGCGFVYVSIYKENFHAYLGSSDTVAWKLRVQPCVQRAVRRVDAHRVFDKKTTQQQQLGFLGSEARRDIMVKPYENSLKS